jgi:hypothetical protein
MENWSPKLPNRCWVNLVLIIVCFAKAGQKPAFVVNENCFSGMLEGNGKELDYQYLKNN